MCSRFFLNYFCRARVPLPGPVDGGRPDLHVHGAEGRHRPRVLRRAGHRQGGHLPEGGRGQLREGPGAAQVRNEAVAGLKVLQRK